VSESDEEFQWLSIRPSASRRLSNRLSMWKKGMDGFERIETTTRYAPRAPASACVSRVSRPSVNHR
jgi:hypothetical protein